MYVYSILSNKNIYNGLLLITQKIDADLALFMEHYIRYNVYVLLLQLYPTSILLYYCSMISQFHILLLLLLLFLI